jgi:hypothetical protein
MLAMVLLGGGLQPAAAGSDPAKEESLTTGRKVRPDRKPVKCIGLVNMSNGVVLPKGKIIGSVKYIYMHKGDLYDGSEHMTGQYNGKYDRVDQVVKLTARAGLFDNFDARVIVPFFDREVKRRYGPKSQFNRKDGVTGLGDIVLMGRYALMKQRSGDWFNLAVGAGLKMPTGDPDKDNPLPFSNTHEYMAPGFQLGTGSWDPKFELGATRFFGRSRVDTHFMLTLPGDGVHGSRKGDQFKYNLGYGYAVNRLFDVELELNGVYQEAHWYDHDSSVNTGGHTIYVTPGVHWKMCPSCHLSLGVPIVVFRDLNGESATPDNYSKYGLGEDFKVVARIGFVF